jgi:protein SCO1/2
MKINSRALRSLTSLFTFISVVPLVLSSCQSRDAVFDEAISRARQTTQTHVSTAQEGLPYFTTKTLNPTWDENGPAPIVRFPEVKWKDQFNQSQNQNFLRGKRTIAAFFFSTCTGFCPMLVQKMKKMQAALKDIPDVQFLGITVDPELDTPARLKIFAHYQGIKDGKTFKLLTADQATINLLVRDTFASQVVARKNKDLRSFAHSEHFYLLDDQARLRGVLNGTRIDAPVEARKMLLALQQK